MAKKISEDQDRTVNEALDGLDQTRREAITRLLPGAFVAPVVASFAMQGLAIRPAEAATSSMVINQTTDPT